MTLGELKEQYFNLVKSRKNDHWMIVDDDDDVEVDLVDDGKSLASYGIGCGEIIKAVPSATSGK